MAAKEKSRLNFNEARYERLLTHLTDYIYTVKIDNGKVVGTNHGPGCFAVTGYSSEDYFEDPDLWLRMVHEDDKQMVIDQAEQALKGIEQQQLEHRIIHRNGSIRWVKNSIVLSKDSDGRVKYYDGIINDITQRREAEHLAAVKQQQLIQADKMASLGILVSGVAHEINNPNNFILLNGRFLEKVWEDIYPILQKYFNENGDFVVSGMMFSEADEKIIRSIIDIGKGSKRIQNIVQNLTEYARKDSGVLSYEVDIKKVVEFAIKIVDNLIRNSTEHFMLNIDDDLPKLKGNSQQLEQVFINLITNACQSLKEKSNSITLNVMQKGELILCEVIDEGIGIEEEDLKYILDPFFTTKRESGGTGLGLSISYKIIKAHGGELKLSSRSGYGTKAEIILPVYNKQLMGQQ